MRWRTTEQKDNQKMTLIIWSSVVGFVLMICSGFFTWWMTTASIYRATYTRGPGGQVNDIGVGKFIPLGVLGIFLGSILGVVGLFYGLWISKTEHIGKRKVIGHARILARFGIDDEGRMQTDETQLEFLDGIKYYVRVLSPTEGSIEYQCVEEVFYACGEGMMGEAEIQGKWLGAFRPYMGGTTTHVGQRF
jgi:hypothetical protein